MKELDEKDDVQVSGEKEQIIDTNDQIIVADEKKAAAKKQRKVNINDVTERNIRAFLVQAGQARKAVDSPEYTAFYASVQNVLDVAETINAKKKKGKPFDEEKLYQAYVNAVNTMKACAKAYEEYKLSYRTEDTKEEPYKEKVNSDDIAKLKVVRAVNSHSFFKVPDPMKKKAPSYLKKTDAALARLQAGNYEDHEAFMEDAVYALVGQMARSTGGAVLIDRNTGKSLSFTAFKNRCIQDGMKDICRDPKNPSKFVSPDYIYKRLTNPKYIQAMADAAVQPDDPKVKLPEDKLRKGGAATQYMLQSFSKDMDVFMRDIIKTYGRGKSDSSPSKLMLTVLNGLHDFAYGAGEKASNSPEERMQKMQQLTPEEFETRINRMIGVIDEYLDRRQNPKKADRVDRNQCLVSLRRKLADYKKENKSIENGHSGAVHEPKIGLKTTGETITCLDLKKNLIKFGFDMAEIAHEGMSLCYRHDPECFNPGLFGEENRPGAPEPKLARVFDAMKAFNRLFMPDENYRVPELSFDIIKKKVVALQRAVTLYKTSIIGKNVRMDISDSVDFIMDNCREMLRNMDALQPYMDMETIEGRFGSKNMYDVAKTMDKPYGDIRLITNEYVISGGIGLGNADANRKAYRTWHSVKGEFGKEKKLLQGAFAKGFKIRGSIMTKENGLDINPIVNRPVPANMSQADREDRKQKMITVAARDIFIRLTDDENSWTELGRYGEEVEDALFNQVAKDVLENNPAFLRVHETSVYRNIGKNVLAEAKRMGTLDELKQQMGPAKLKEIAKTMQAEKNANAKKKVKPEAVIKA